MKNSNINPRSSSNHSRNDPLKDSKIKRMTESFVQKCNPCSVNSVHLCFVLSQRFKAEFKLPPFELYRSLRSLNPSPFLFYSKRGVFCAIVGVAAYQKNIKK